MKRMLRTRTVMASLVVVFVVLSVLAYSGAAQHVDTGTVREFEPGEWMSVGGYDGTDWSGFEVTLRETTVYEGNPAAIKPGTRVTVWFRSVGERRFVADKVRVLTDATTH